MGGFASSPLEKGQFWSLFSRKAQPTGARGTRTNPAPSAAEQADNNFRCVSTLPVEPWSQMLTDCRSKWVWLSYLPDSNRRVAQDLAPAPRQQAFAHIVDLPPTPSRPSATHSFYSRVVRGRITSYVSRLFLPGPALYLQEQEIHSCNWEKIVIKRGQGI